MDDSVIFRPTVYFFLLVLVFGYILLVALYLRVVRLTIDDHIFINKTSGLVASPLLLLSVQLAIASFSILLLRTQGKQKMCHSIAFLRRALYTGFSLSAPWLWLTWFRSPSFACFIPYSLAFCKTRDKWEEISQLVMFFCGVFCAGSLTTTILCLGVSIGLTLSISLTNMCSDELPLIDMSFLVVISAFGLNAGPAILTSNFGDIIIDQNIAVITVKLIFGGIIIISLVMSSCALSRIITGDILITAVMVSISFSILIEMWKCPETGTLSSVFGLVLSLLWELVFLFGEQLPKIATFESIKEILYKLGVVSLDVPDEEIAFNPSKEVDPS